MTKKLRRSLLMVFISAFMIVMMLFAASCKKADTGGFSLDKTNINVRIGDDAEILHVLKDGEVYNGNIAWATLDDQYVQVAQGYVKGLAVGTGEITATIKTNGKSYVLACQVTVHAKLSLIVEDMYTYSATGSIDVTTSQNALSKGATLDKVTVSRTPAGEELTGILEITSSKKGTSYALTNTVEKPLDAGIYYVNYSYSKDGETRITSRKVTVRSSENYENLFLLSAFDGNEYIKGSAVDSSHTEVPSEVENPGTFFTYSNDMTALAGMNQSKDEFLNSLKLSGYEGNLREGIDGYDSVYTMQTVKSNKPQEPHVYFYTNLFGSANPVWDNLSKIPSSATIEVWARMWLKDFGTDEYYHGSCVAMSLFKNMNAGATIVSGTWTTGNYDANGGWTRFTLPISNIVSALAGAKNIGIKIDHYKNGFAGDLYLELYSVELNLGGLMTAPLGDVDIALPGDYTGLLDDYSWEIINSDNEIVKSSFDIGQRGTLVEDLPVGAYTVKYTVDGMDWIIEKPLASGVAGYFNDKTLLKPTAWGTTSKMTVVNTPKSIGVPKDRIDIGKLQSYTSDSTNATQFYLVSLWNTVENLLELDENYAVGLWIYIQGSNNNLSMNPWTIWVGHGDDWSKQGSGVVIESSTSIGEWCRLEVRVSELKKAYDNYQESAKAGGWPTTGTTLRFHQRATAEYTVYFHSVEYYDAGQIDPAKLTPTYVQTISSVEAQKANVSKVSVSDAGIGQPVTAQTTVDKLTLVTETDGDGQICVGIRVPNLYGVLDTLSPADVVRTWVYVQSAHSYKQLVYGSIFVSATGEPDWGIEGYGFARANKYAEWAGYQEKFVCDSWIPMDVTVAELLAAQKSISNPNYLTWYIGPGDWPERVAGHKLYIHSVEIVTGGVALANNGYSNYWGGAKATVVTPDATIGVPTNAVHKNAQVLSIPVLRTTDGYNTASFTTGDGMYNLMRALTKFDPNDKLGFWVYASGDASTKYQMAISPWNAGTTESAGYYKFQKMAEFSCGSWQRVEVSIGTLQEVLAQLTVDANNRYTQMALSSIVCSGSVPSNPIIYYHSIEYIDVK